MRFVYNLLPLLKEAETPARVVSVFLAGKECQIILPFSLATLHACH